MNLQQLEWDAMLTILGEAILGPVALLCLVVFAGAFAFGYLTGVRVE